MREPGRQSVEPGPWIEIVGVTADMSTAARKAIKDAHLYRPIGAVPPGPVTLVVHAQPGYRTEGLGQVAAAVRATAAATLRVTRVSSARPMNAGARRIAPSHHHRHSLEAFLQIGLGVAAGVLPGGVIVGLVSAESGRNGLVDGITVAAAVAAFVLIIAAAACSVPLRRALRIEPTEALRVT